MIMAILALLTIRPGRIGRRSLYVVSTAPKAKDYTT